MNEEVADYGEDDSDMYAGTDVGAGGDAEIEEMKRRVQEMENEHEKLTEMQQSVDKQLSTAEMSIDENSIYVGQVDYEATPEELRAHFAACGTINRVTILCDKFTGHPKGFAYVEFADAQSVENAVKLDDTAFKGRQLKVTPKRVNEPSFGGRGGRGRGGRGGGRGFPGRGYAGRGFGGRGRGAPVYGRGRGGGSYGGGRGFGRGGGRGYQGSYY